MRLTIVFGISAGLLVAGLRWAEYRFLVVEHSFEVYTGIIAVTFAAVGLWLGQAASRRRVVVRDVPVLVEVPVRVEVRVEAPAESAPVFAPNPVKVEELGVTPRELEILGLIADGLSTREMADRLCVSENTIKTHCTRVFAKLGASRRTQAVQVGRTLGLIRS